MTDANGNVQILVVISKEKIKVGLPKIEGIKKQDMFYDETPRMKFRYEMKVNTSQYPYAFTYSIMLDGVEDDAKIRQLHTEAQCDMYRALTRIQSNNEDAEFVAWRCFDEAGAMIEESNVISVYVKDIKSERVISGA